MNIKPISFSPLLIKENNTTQINNSQTLSISKTSTKDIGISNAFYYPVNFTSKTKRTFETEFPKLAEKSYKFMLAKISDIPCPACGKLIMTPKKYYAFKNDLQWVEPEDYLEYLGYFTDYMCPTEEQAYHELCALSESLGDKEGAKDLRTLTVMLRNEKLPILQSVQIKLINKMKALAQSLPEDEKTELLNKIASLKTIIKNKKPSAPFRRKILIDDIKNMKIRNANKHNKLIRIAEKFPTSTDMIAAWFVKYSGKNKHGEDYDSYTIATRFINHGNTDHIIPYSENNRRNDIGNYQLTHESCNNKKANKSVQQYINENPKIKEYTQRYLDYCNYLLSTRRITKNKYKKYIPAVIQTFFEATKGQVLFKDNKTPENNEFMQ